MAARVVAAGADGIALARELLEAGELVAFPTETYYGLAADARSAEAVARVFAAKRRQADAPVALIARDLEAVRALCDGPLPEAVPALAERFWPGPLTVILRAAPSVPPALTAGTRTIGVRVSPHRVAAALAEAFPVTATSANRAGRPALRRAGEVAAELPEIALVLDGGETPGGAPSTLVDLTTAPPRVLRAGAVPTEELREVLAELAAS